MKDKLSKLSILVVNFKYDLREDNDLVELTKDGEASEVFKNIPGLGIKFGLANPEENEYGGIYIFEDDTSLEAYLASPILKEWAENPDVSELTYKKKFPTPIGVLYQEEKPTYEDVLIKKIENAVKNNKKNINDLIKGTHTWEVT